MLAQFRFCRFYLKTDARAIADDPESGVGG